MSQIMKTFMGVFLIILMLASIGGVLGAFLDVIAAQNLHSQIICELEDSDFAPEVIKDCFNMASECGDKLTIELYKSNNTTQIYDSVNSVSATGCRVDMAKVELKFDYSVPLFNICSSHVLSGFAR